MELSTNQIETEDALLKTQAVSEVVAKHRMLKPTRQANETPTASHDSAAEQRHHLLDLLLKSLLGLRVDPERCQKRANMIRSKTSATIL